MSDDATITAGREPVERDTLYNEIRNYKDVDLDKTDLDDIQMDASLN